MSKTPLAEIAREFFVLGATAFGGPAAHIARMRARFVEEKKWLSERSFLDMLGAVNLIPGPNSTELAIHLGFSRGRVAGLLIAGLGFIVPAMLIVGVLAALYKDFQVMPSVGAVMYGLKPVVVAVVFQAIWGLYKPACRTPVFVTLGVLGLIASLARVPELLILFGTGLVTAAFAWRAETKKSAKTSARPFLILCLVCAVAIALPMVVTWLTTPAWDRGVGRAEFSLPALFLYFLRVGSTLYGSGYVLMSFLRETLVLKWHWISESQLLDSVAIGQVTPGPVFTTATFIGYLVGGPVGALLATIAIFLPSFLLVGLGGPLIPRLRKFPLTGAFLDGVNVAALALLASVTLQLGRAALVDFPSILIAVVSAFLLIRFKVNSAWLILGGGLLGFLLRTLLAGDTG